MATIDNVTVDHSPNQGRNITNANDTAINTELGTVANELNTHTAAAAPHTGHETQVGAQAKADVVQSNLDTHKASADHDAAYVKKTGAETVAGEKTFSDNVKISKSNSTALLTLDSVNNSNRRQVQVAHYNYTDFHALLLQLNKNTPESPNWEEILWAASNDKKVSFPNRDVYSNGKKLATEEYVQDRVKTGINNIPLALYIASPAQNTTYTFPIVGGGTVKIPIVRATNIREYKILAEGDLVTMDTGVVSYQFSQSEIDNAIGNNILVPKIITGAATPNMQIKVKLFALKITGGALVETQIYDSGFLMNASLSSGTPTTINMNILTSL